MNPEDLMRYDAMTQKALRGVVRCALEVAASEAGLPGEHHFYISFHTTAPGVHISDRLRARYPEEMTIVLQHQFWNLQVEPEGFRVSLSFDKIPETLEIPYSALAGFFDPSVQFGLQFTLSGDLREAESGEKKTSLPPQSPREDLDTEDLDTEDPDTGKDGVPGDRDSGAQQEKNGEVVRLDTFRKNR